MSRRGSLRFAQAAIGSIALLAFATSGDAQGLSQRVASAPDGKVSFNYAARSGSCGDGKTFIRYVSAGGSTNYYGMVSSTVTDDSCVKGPVRVVLDMSAKVAVGVRSYVGPLATSEVEGVRDLGSVSVREASQFLLDLASRADGSVARDAIMPAMLADSVDNFSSLLGISRDKTRARETRRTAINWLARSGTAAQLIQPLVAIVNDQSDAQQVRSQALSSLVRLDGGAGLATVVQIADSRGETWLRRSAVSALAQSGDPRARDYLRRLVEAGDDSDEVLSVAVNSLGRQYATASDLQVIRDAYPSMKGSRSQNAAISAIAEAGGAENAKFLLNVARDPARSVSTRSNALRSALRGGASLSDVIGMYDQTVDYQLKEAIITTLVQSDERIATDKLLSIAKSDDNVSARRRAIAVLGRSSDPRVRRELELIATKP